MDARTKGSLVEELIKDLPRYQRELVRDLAYGAVDLPPSWLGPGEATLISLDAHAGISAGQRERLHGLVGRCVALVALIDVLIRAYVARERAAGSLPKNDADSLVRGRGPAQVRSLLFAEARPWPAESGPALRTRVGEVLDRCRRDRLADRIAEERAAHVRPQDLASLVRPVIGDLDAAVGEWAGRRHLARTDQDWVLSEVLDQLVRTAARDGLPTDVRRWSLVTAKRKWRAGTVPPDLADDAEAPETATPGDPTDAVLERLDTNTRLREAGLLAARHAAALEVNGRPDDAAAHGVAADLLLRGDPAVVADALDATPEGLAEIDRLLTARGYRGTDGRTAAVIRLVRDRLRETFTP